MIVAWGRATGERALASGGLGMKLGSLLPCQQMPWALWDSLSSPVQWEVQWCLWCLTGWWWGPWGAHTVPGACSVCVLTYSSDLNGDQQEGTSSFELFPGCGGEKLPKLSTFLAFILQYNQFYNKIMQTFLALGNFRLNYINVCQGHDFLMLCDG